MSLQRLGRTRRFPSLKAQNAQNTSASTQSAPVSGTRYAMRTDTIVGVTDEALHVLGVDSQFGIDANLVGGQVARLELLALVGGLDSDYVVIGSFDYGAGTYSEVSGGTYPKAGARNVEWRGNFGSGETVQWALKYTAISGVPTVTSIGVKNTNIAYDRTYRRHHG